MPGDTPQHAGISTTYDLQYTLERDDLVALTRYHLAHSRLYTFVWIAATAGIALALGIFIPSVAYLIFRLLGRDWVQPAYRPFVYGIVVAQLVMFALMLANRKKTLEWFANELASKNIKGLKALGRRRLTLSKQGITAVGAKGETSRPWETVTNIVTTDDRVLVCADVVFAIPRNAFANKDEFEAFLKVVDEWRRVAK